jgi:DNA repair protein RecN (Recombination protein N)
MLERLSVRGLGIIDVVELEFAAGFAALTGETGAGKSLLVESLKLLGGQRAQSDMVRSGDDRLQVEGVFLLASDSEIEEILDELGIADRKSLILRREVTTAGRSRCWINDSPVTTGALQRLAPHLLAIHGQHEQYGLADPAVQRGLVDNFAGHGELLEQVRSRYASWQEAAAELDRLRAARATRRDRLDTISFQLDEIESVGPGENEDVDLRQRRLVLRHSARLAELSVSLIERLSDGETAVVDDLARAERELVQIADCGIPQDDAVQRLTEARFHVEEVVREIRGLADQSAGDPGELEALESRLHTLDQLMLKYGATVGDVRAHRDALLKERGDLESVEERLEEAEDAARLSLAAFDESARVLDEARKKAGADFASEVEEVLARLAMADTRLEFSWQPRVDAKSPLTRCGQPVAFDADGVEDCVLLIAANPGEDLRPMARIASGGELSRVHLALRTVLRGKRPIGGLTLLFDEVDSGLGGATAAALAALLADLAVADQVLVVTHLPQVAARAGGHYRVEKVLDDGRATTRVGRLDDSQRETEVARMLAGGELTSSAREHARVLLNGS